MLFILLFSYTEGKLIGIDFTGMGWTLFRSFKWETQKMIVWRVIFGLSNLCLALGTVYFLPLTIAQSMLACGIFTQMLLGWIILDEQLSLKELLTIIGGMVGVFILLNP